MPLPNEIQTGRLNAILHKLLGITEGAPAPSLAPDLFSMLCLENDRPEWKFLAGERLCCGSGTVAAGGAGLYSTFVLWNPPGSGVLGVLERIGNWDANAQAMILRANYTDPSGAGYGTAGHYRGLRDLRHGATATSKPTLLIYSVATVSPLGLNVLQSFYLGTAGLFEIDVVIPPGYGLTVHSQNANQQLRVNFLWRERVLEPSERR